MITEKEKLLIFLSMYELSVKKQEEILECLHEFSIEQMLNSLEVVKLLSADVYHKMLANYDRRAFDNSVENMLKSGIKILTIDSEEYPSSMADLPDRPLLLYAKGNLELLKKPAIAVVGTRKPTNYGKIMTARLVEDLARSGLVVVSGLCYGVDEIAHRKTLEVGGETIAVVGSGFNKIYPATNTPLSEEIAQKGLLLSEYPPSFQAKRYTFPKRNRILVALSQGVLITEAGFKSGTLHTKEFALEYGKDIFAVPGNVNSDKSDLPNAIIKNAEGQCVTEVDDILKYYNIKKKSKTKMFELNLDEQKIVELLSDGEKDFAFLAENSQISVNILNSCLTTLEIRGLIRKLPGQIFALV